MITVAKTAALMRVGERRVREMIMRGEIVARRETLGKNALGYLVLVDSLPDAAKAAYYSENPIADVVPASPSGAALPHPRFDAAPLVMKERAMRRHEILCSYVDAFRGESVASDSDAIAIDEAAKRSTRTIAQVEDDWQRENAELLGHYSLASVRRWLRWFRARGLDGLVDHNDGTSKRGKFSIPISAREFFTARYLDGSSPTIKRAIEDTRLAAREFGWQLPKRDDPFYRFEKTIPKAVKSARRGNVDKQSAVMPFVMRAMDVPYRTLQSDHHIADVFVNCEGTVCGGGGCQMGHRPWWTPMFDVGSRKIISSRVSLEVPNSARILDAFKAAVAAEGLPERFYCDNGKDFKKAAEWKGLSRDDQEFVGRRFKTLGIEVVFAKPYNAQAKAIERLFGTFVKRWWQGSSSYTGPLGKRTDRVKELCKRPELLPTFSSFVTKLEAAITIYNNTPHRGYGMRGRTPVQALVEERIPRRVPDPFAFALVFYRCEERVVDRNGVRIDNLTYRLTDERVQVRHQGERVKVLINPDDISRAIVVSLAEEFLSEATRAELATHDTRDAVTQRELEAIQNRRTERRREFRRSGSPQAARDLRLINQGFDRLLVAAAAERREEESKLVAAAGGSAAVTAVIPKYSPMSRAMTRARQHNTSSPLSAADQALAASIPPLTEARLDELLAEMGRNAPASNGSFLRLAGSSESGEHQDYGEMLVAEARRRELRENCRCVSCARRYVTFVVRQMLGITEVDVCGTCWLEINGEDIDPKFLAELRKAIEEEERDQ